MMIEVAVGTIVSKAGFGVIAAVFKSLTTAAIKKYKDSKVLQIPSSRDLHQISDWYEEQLKASILENGEELDPALANYLSSREFTTFIQYIFVYIFVGKPTEEARELQLELERGLHSYGYENSDDTKVLYRILCRVSHAIYKVARVDDLELPQEASIEAHSIITTAMLGSIENQLSRIASLDGPSVKEMELSVDRYKQAVITKFGKIQPQSFDGAPTFDIDKLYVVPSLSISSGESDGEPISYQKMVSNYRRCVVVGDPGGGKYLRSTQPLSPPPRQIL